MRIYFLLLISFLISFTLIGNTAVQDSLLLRLSEVEDSAQIQILEELAMLPDISKDQQLAYFNQAIEMSEELNNPVVKANTLFLLGRAYVRIEKFEEALVVGQEALTLLNENNELYESTKVLTLIGTIYFYLGDLNLAIDYFTQVLEIRYELGDKIQISKALMNVGNVFGMKGDMDEAMDYYQRALKIKEELNDSENLSQLYNNIANIHFAKGEMDQVLPYRLKALRMDRLAGDQYQIALKTYNLAEFYLSINEPQNALTYIVESKSIAEKIGDYGLINDNIHFLSMYYESLNDYSKALEYYKVYANSIKETFSKELSERVGELQVKYETEKKDKETQAIKLQLEKNNYQKLVLFFLSIIGFLMTSFIIFLYLRKKKNNQFLENEVQRRTNELQNKNEELERKGIELTKSKEKAEESDLLKSAFLTNMSHEIRTPLNSILGFTNLLIDTDLAGSDKEKYAGIIKRGSDRMVTTIDHIIEASRIETSQIDVVETKLVVNKLVEDVFYKFSEQNKNERIKFSFAVGLPEKESIIISDKSKVEAILTHLLTNAFKFTKEGFIHLGYRRKDSFLEFYVNDSGIGVPKVRQAAIFDLFVKSDIEDRDAYQGNGLGLFLAKSYVNLLGGEIGVNSDNKTGSSFYFTIPYLNYTHQDNVVLNPMATGIAPKEKVNDLKVLIVEDDVNSGIYLTAIVKQLTNDILLASNGVEAVNTCQQHQDIDLILMDIKMPEKNGIEAVNKIRKFNKQVYIIAQTAYALIGDSEKAIEAGCDDFISKPFRKDDLLAKIRKFTDEAHR